MQKLVARIFKICPHALDSYQQTLVLHVSDSDSSSFWHIFIMNYPFGIKECGQHGFDA